MSKHQFTDIRVAIEPDNPSIQRLEFKCIKCGNCKTVCTDYIGVCGTYDLKATGDKPICINCGQCANMCPVDSITEKVEAYQVMAEIRDTEKLLFSALRLRCALRWARSLACLTAALWKAKWWRFCAGWAQIMCLIPTLLPI